MYLLEMNHIKKSFDGQGVLKDISLAVAEGEIVSIIGPSGSGKSTLLRCATMLERMDSGELLYLGEKAAWNGPDGNAVYAGKEKQKEIQGNYGLVFQNFNLFPHYNVLKNIIDAPIHVQKRKSEEVIREAYDLLRKMGLEDKAEIDQAITDILTSTDETERQELYDFVLTRLHEDAVYIPLTYETNKALYTSELKGVHFGTDQYDVDFASMYFE